MQILKKHFYNLNNFISHFNSLGNRIENIDVVAHWNFKTTTAEGDSYFHHYLETLRLIESFIDNAGNTQYSFFKPFDTSIYFVSVVKDYKNMCDDKVIFRLSDEG